MGLPRVLLTGGWAVPVGVSLHLSVPIASARCPIEFWTKTLQLRLTAVPSPAVEGLLTPGIKVGVQLGKEDGRRSHRKIAAGELQG